MYCNGSKVILQHPSDQQLECVAAARQCTIDICIQEQTGRTLDRYGHMKVSANKLINLKYKDKYKYIEIHDNSALIAKTSEAP